MKITNTNAPVTKSFGELQDGDVFRREGTHIYYIKVNKQEVITGHKLVNGHLDLVTEDRNAVRLSDGVCTMFHKGTNVIPVDCELVIK